MKSHEWKIKEHKTTPMEAALKDEQRYLKTLFFQGWVDESSTKLGRNDYEGGLAIRLATPKARIYDCWIPDPDDDECALHILIDEDDLVRRFANTKNIIEFMQIMDCNISEFQGMTIFEKLNRLMSNLDILDFLELDDVPEGTLWFEVKLIGKVTNDILRVQTLENSI